MTDREAVSRCEAGETGEGPLHSPGGSLDRREFLGRGTLGAAGAVLLGKGFSVPRRSTDESLEASRDTARAAETRATATAGGVRAWPDRPRGWWRTQHKVRKPPSDAEVDYREIDLDIQIVRHEIVPGYSFHALAFNGQVPGPELRLNEGEWVKVNFTNRTELLHTIHWHGVDLQYENDGVPYVTPTVMATGDAKAFRRESERPLRALDDPCRRRPPGRPRGPRAGTVSEPGGLARSDRFQPVPGANVSRCARIAARRRGRGRDRNRDRNTGDRPGRSPAAEESRPNGHGTHDEPGRPLDGRALDPGPVRRTSSSTRRRGILGVDRRRVAGDSSHARGTSGVQGAGGPRSGRGAGLLYGVVAPRAGPHARRGRTRVPLRPGPFPGGS